MREETEALLREQGLWQHRDALATGLPYGLQRRLEIARALATEPNSCCWMNRLRDESAGDPGTGGLIHEFGTNTI